MRHSASYAFILTERNLKTTFFAKGIASAASERIVARVGSEAAYAISPNEIVTRLDSIADALKHNVRANIDASRLAFFEIRIVALNYS